MIQPSWVAPAPAAPRAHVLNRPTGLRQHAPRRAVPRPKGAASGDSRNFPSASLATVSRGFPREDVAQGTSASCRALTLFLAQPGIAVHAKIAGCAGHDRGAELVLTCGRLACHLPAETACTSTGFTIFEGTSEIQRMIIGRAVTGLDVRLITAGHGAGADLKRASELRFLAIDRLPVIPGWFPPVPDSVLSWC